MDIITFLIVVLLIVLIVLACKLAGIGRGDYKSSFFIVVVLVAFVVAMTIDHLHLLHI